MSIRLGTASPASQPTTAATLTHLSQIAHRAASQKIDILLLPEAFIGGYPRGTAFGCVIGDRAPGGREEFAKYFDSAVDLGDTVGNGAGAGAKWVRRELGDGETLRGDGTRETLERVAKDTGVFIVVGCIERTGGSLYCTVVYVCPKEGIIGKRRKVMPTGTERLIWAQGSPSTLRAVSTTIRGTRINLAAAICWENYMPLLRQSLYAQNINLYLAPTADGRDAWLSLMRSIGVEGRCFVVSSNMCIKKEGSQQAAPTTARQGEASSPIKDKPARGLRRNSTITLDGHEIVLPAAPEASPPPRRRMSVFDDDGNEIVLCCEEKQDKQMPKPTSISEKAATATLPQTDDAASYHTGGGSSIVDPYGEVLAGPQWEDADGLIYADVDFRECIRGRLDLDTAGSYSRNDSFKFSVDGLDLDPLPY